MPPYYESANRAGDVLPVIVYQYVHFRGRAVPLIPVGLKENDAPRPDVFPSLKDLGAWVRSADAECGTGRPIALL